MSGALHLTITTPSEVLVDAADVWAVRADDESGGFGILPGHADLLTVLTASVVRWRTQDGPTRYCAVRGGVMTVAAGKAVAIACRQGSLGDDLATLETAVHAHHAEETDAERRARVAQEQLHARAVRQLIRYLLPHPAGGGAATDAPEGGP